MKFSFILIMTLACVPLFSQEVNPKILDEINERGKLYTMRLKNGEIDFLKKSTPPKDTWSFSKLEEYKHNLGSNDIIYGSIIMPNEDKTFYSYNLFAYDIKKETYYFVAIVSYQMLEDSIKYDNSYLFTEKKSLKDWWIKMFGFYQSEKINNIPKKYLFGTCPPPPFKI